MKKFSLGHYNTLRILSFNDHGAMLDGGSEEILMPKKYVEASMKPGDEVRVFVYLDQSDRLVATTEQAKGEVGQFCFLRVSWVNRYGAFLDWGLTKDLFVPYREQAHRMVRDGAYLVYIYIDDMTGRIVATSKLARYVSPISQGYREGQEVEAIVWQPTAMGYKVIVDGRYGGLVYRNEVFRPLYVGNVVKGYVKTVRTDGKLDIALQGAGPAHVDDFSARLYDELVAAGGHLAVGDDTPAEEIYRMFGVSKKTFKRAVGSLYKRRAIAIGDDGLRLAD